jgi:hypothetical protein
MTVQSAPPNPQSALADLKKDADIAQGNCYREQGLWAKIYYGTKASLIVFATLSSAQALGAAPSIFHWAQPRRRLA